MKNLCRKSLIAILFLTIGGCGGGSSSSDSSGGGTTTADTSNLTVQVTVTQPVAAASLSLPMLSTRALRLSNKFTTEAGASDTLHVEDAAGVIIEGLTGTTDTTGVANVEIPQAVLDDGCRVCSDTTGECDYIEPTDAEITAAVAAEAAGTTTTLTEEVSPESTQALASLDSSCGGDIATCDTDVDKQEVYDFAKDQVEQVVEDGTAPSADTVEGVVAISYALTTAVINESIASGGTVDVDDALSKAQQGDTSGIDGLTVEGVTATVVAASAVQQKAVNDNVRDSYCKRDGTTDSPGRTIQQQAGTTYDRRAMFAPFAALDPAVLNPTNANYIAPTNFRRFAENLPNVTGGFDMFANHSQARDLAGDMIKQGDFAHADTAGPAMGFMFSAFPPCNGNCRTVTFEDTFDHSLARDAVHNVFLDYTATATAGSYLPPNQILGKFNTIMMSPVYQQSFAAGGTAAAGNNFIGDFVNNFDNWDPTARILDMKAPPGSSCTSDSNCLPCDTCVIADGDTSGLCTSNSTTMGRVCGDGLPDCDAITVCNKPVFSPSGSCMCAQGVPPGAMVFQAGGVLTAGQTGGYVPPQAGATGGACGGSVGCPSGASCSGGVCLPSGFKKGPGTSCSEDTECDSSDGCQLGRCALLTQQDQIDRGFAVAGGAGLLSAGDHCTASYQCSTNTCVFATSTCLDFADLPTTFQQAILIAPSATNLKANDESCHGGAECRSFFCHFTTPPPAPGTLAAATTVLEGVCADNQNQVVTTTTNLNPCDGLTDANLLKCVTNVPPPPVVGGITLTGNTTGGTTTGGINPCVGLSGADAISCAQSHGTTTGGTTGGTSSGGTSSGGTTPPTSAPPTSSGTKIQGDMCTTDGECGLSSAMPQSCVGETSTSIHVCAPACSNTAPCGTGYSCNTATSVRGQSGQWCISNSFGGGSSSGTGGTTTGGTTTGGTTTGGTTTGGTTTGGTTTGGTTTGGSSSGGSSSGGSSSGGSSSGGSSSGGSSSGGSSSGGSSSGGPQSCTSDSSCSAPTTSCVSNGGSGACAKPCTVPADCTSGLSCQSKVRFGAAGSTNVCVP